MLNGRANSLYYPDIANDLIAARQHVNEESFDCAQGLARFISGKTFQCLIITIGLGLGIYVADIISDLAVGLAFYFKEDIFWASLTLGLIAMPGIIRGIYELGRRPVAYQNATQTFVILGKNSFGQHLNFGLDVFPRAYVRVPQSILAALICQLFYLVVMALWFPFLPLLQYTKVARLQLLITPESNLDELVRIRDEQIRAVSLKSVETFLESAPQLFLQIYILYRTVPSERTVMSLISIGFSMGSLVKTCFDVQEVDRYLNAISRPSSFTRYLATSVLWFLSTIAFRSLSISVISLYITQIEFYRGFILIPALLTGNILIRKAFKTKTEILHAIMTIIAPAYMIVGSSPRSTELQTLWYIGTYTLFNTLVYGSLLVDIYLHHGSQTFPYVQLVTRDTLNNYLLPTCGILGILSILSPAIHCQWSLKELFRAEWKHPQYQNYKKRVKSFPQGWPYPGHSSHELAKNGLFHVQSITGPLLCCFDCGISFNECYESINPAIIHAARLLQYRITYFESLTESRSQNPDRLRGALSKANIVKPICGVLERCQIDFSVAETRRSTFNEHWSKRFPNGVSPGAVANAGFVSTGGSSAVCFQCYAGYDWSNSATLLNTPWGLHAQHKRSENCDFMTRKLGQVRIRVLSFPNSWRLSTRGPQKHCPKFAQAGFYCQRWTSGCAWLKCFSCSAFASFWPFLGNLGNTLSRIAPLQGQTEIPGPNYQMFDAETDIGHWALVLHYTQNINCAFIQDTFFSSEFRARSFPTDWAEIVGSETDVESIARAGFIYYPMSSLRDMNRMKEVRKNPVPHTICPKCLTQVDWSRTERSPGSVRHCLRNIALRSELQQMFSARNLSGSAE